MLLIGRLEFVLWYWIHRKCDAEPRWCCLTSAAARWNFTKLAVTWPCMWVAGTTAAQHVYVCWGLRMPPFSFLLSVSLYLSVCLSVCLWRVLRLTRSPTGIFPAGYPLPRRYECFTSNDSILQLDISTRLSPCEGLQPKHHELPLHMAKCVLHNTTTAYGCLCCM